MIFTYAPVMQERVVCFLFYSFLSLFIEVFPYPFSFFTRPGKSFWFVQQVTLGKVLKAIVVMRSLFIDRTIVRGFSENIYSEDGKVRFLIFTVNL